MEPEDSRKLSEIEVLMAEGWRPRVKTVKGNRYLVLSKGSEDKGFGRLDQELWNVVSQLRSGEPPPATTRRLLTFEEQRDQASRRPSGVLKVKLDKPKAIPSAVTLETSTLMWYEWALTKGFRGDLGQFLNEVTKAYFTEKGLELVLAVKEVEE
jgi:hypothetical protein